MRWLRAEAARSRKGGDLRTDQALRPLVPTGEEIVPGQRATSRARAWRADSGGSPGRTRVPPAASRPRSHGRLWSRRAPRPRRVASPAAAAATRAALAFDVCATPQRNRTRSQARQLRLIAAPPQSRPPRRQFGRRISEACARQITGKHRSGTASATSVSPMQLAQGQGRHFRFDRGEVFLQHGDISRARLDRRALRSIARVVDAAGEAPGVAPHLRADPGDPRRCAQVVSRQLKVAQLALARSGTARRASSVARTPWI